MPTPAGRRGAEEAASQFVDRIADPRASRDQAAAVFRGLGARRRLLGLVLADPLPPWRPSASWPAWLSGGPPQPFATRSRSASPSDLKRGDAFMILD